jgi:hypothetical protein
MSILLGNTIKPDKIEQGKIITINREKGRVSLFLKNGLVSAGSYLYDLTDLHEGENVLVCKVNGQYVILNKMGGTLLPRVAATYTVPTPPPPIPANPVVAGGSSSVLSWDASPRAVSYIIYWDTSPGVTTGDNKITGITDLTYTHIPTSSGDYYYRISSVDGRGQESELSDEIHTSIVLDVDPDQILVLNFEGDEGDTTYINEAPAAPSLTHNVYSSITNLQSKFGSGSLYVNHPAYTHDWAGLRYDLSDTPLTNWTLHSWFRIERADMVNYETARMSFLIGDYSANYRWIELYYNVEYDRFGMQAYDASTRWGHNLGTVSLTIPFSTWIHIAITASSGVVKVYINGSLKGSLTSALSNAWEGNFDLEFGLSGQYNSSGTVAWIDGCVLTNRILWTTDFVPPTSAP